MKISNIYSNASCLRTSLFFVYRKCTQSSMANKTARQGNNCKQLFLLAMLCQLKVAKKYAVTAFILPFQILILIACN